MTGQGAPSAAVRRAVGAALAGRGDGPFVVACSGGADSLALAAATARVAPPGTVRAVVVDHGLQAGSGEQADRAVAALRGPAIGLPPGAVDVEAVDVAGPGGPEAAARHARRAALRRVAHRTGGAAILLGHTLDDQAETVLLGLGRGSGARSLAGMARWDPPWLRPLLGLRRATTRAACAEAGLQPWDDPHNHDARFTRARLRAEVLPLLEDVLAGGVAEALARTAHQLAEDDAALSARGAEVAALVAGPHGDLDAATLAGHPAAVRRRVLREWLGAAGVAELSDAHLRAVDGLVGAWRGQGPPSLPGGLEVVRRHGRLSVRPSGGRGCDRDQSGGRAGALRPPTTQ